MKKILITTIILILFPVFLQSQVNVIGTLQQKNDGTFAIVDSYDLLGGAMSGADRTGVPAERRKNGMLFMDTDDNKVYQLQGGVADVDWAEVTFVVSAVSGSAAINQIAYWSGSNTIAGSSDFMQYEDSVKVNIPFVLGDTLFIYRTPSDTVYWYATEDTCFYHSTIITKFTTPGSRSMTEDDWTDVYSINGEYEFTNDVTVDNLYVSTDAYVYGSFQGTPETVMKAIETVTSVTEVVLDGDYTSNLAANDTAFFSDDYGLGGTVTLIKRKISTVTYSATTLNTTVVMLSADQLPDVDYTHILPEDEVSIRMADKVNFNDEITVQDIDISGDNNSVTMGTNIVGTPLGGYNVDIGWYTGFKTGNYTISIGSVAGYGYGFTGLNYNVNIGHYSGYATVSDLIQNVNIGREAGYGSKGSNNTFLGGFAGYLLAGQHNVAIGSLAGSNFFTDSTRQSKSVMIGYGAGIDSYGIVNNYLGRNAGKQHTGDSCNFIGDGVGYNLTATERTIIDGMYRTDGTYLIDLHTDLDTRRFNSYAEQIMFAVDTFAIVDYADITDTLLTLTEDGDMDLDGDLDVNNKASIATEDLTFGGAVTFEDTIVGNTNIVIDADTTKIIGAIQILGEILGEKPYGEMYIVNNSTAITINTQDNWQAVSVLLLEGYTEGFTYQAGTSGTISVYADSASTRTTVTTSAAHSLSAGDYISIDGTTNYDSIYLVTSSADNTHFVIDGDYTANDGAGNFNRGVSLTCDEGSAGMYRGQWNSGGQSAAANQDFIFAPCKNTDIAHKALAPRRFSNTDNGSFSGGALVDVNVGDKIFFLIMNQTSAGNVTLLTFDLNLIRL